MRNANLENPLTKSNLISQPETISRINLSDIPDFLRPESTNSELFIYLTQKINWPYYSFQDIYEKAKIKEKSFQEMVNEIISLEKEARNKIINSAKDGNDKLLIKSIHDYMKILNIYFYKFGDKIRTFIFLEYFLKKVEKSDSISNSDEFCHLIKLYFNLCRDAENFFDYLESKKLLIKTELFYYEKGSYYERIHKYLEANNTYIEGFINILGDNDPQKGKLLMNHYINFEERMNARIVRDLEGLNDNWELIDEYIQKKIIETRKNENRSKKININLNSKKKYFLKEEETNEKFLERKLIKDINIDFSLNTGSLTIKPSTKQSQGIEIIGFYGNVKYIKNPPDISKVTSITSVYELMKKVLKTFFPEWKKEYEDYDLAVKKTNEQLPYSWINKLRPTKRNIKNIEENNTVLNLVQKEYLNAGNDNIKKDNKNNIEINNNNNLKDDIEENKENDHEISNMLSNIGLILEKKDSNPININNNINNNSNINTNINKKEKIIPISIIEKDNKTLIANMQYQMEHPYENKSKSRNKEINQENNTNNNSNKKIKKKTGIKTNKFKNVGKLDFDQDGLMIINLENDMDKKIDIMQSASKLLLNNEYDKEKKANKKYTKILDNIPRRIKYIKEKTIYEKKMFDIRKKEMLQGVNFDYLNSFKKLFETYPELNNLVEPSKMKKTEEYNLEINKNKNNTNKENIIEETNIQRQEGPSDAMKLLLEVYGIPQNFLEENNPFMEYAKKNGINSNFAFENLFKDIKSYINAKNSKKRTNIYKNSKKNNKIEEKENIDTDGDLIIESETEENPIENNNDNNKINKKGSKHIVFDSKKNSQIVYIKNEPNEEGDEMGKIIENINKKAEKGIKIGEKTIFSNYKGVKEHSFNFNNKNNKLRENNNNINDDEKLLINQSIQLSIKNDNNKENSNIINNNKMQEELNKKKMIINNSKISTKVFMSAFNYDLNMNNNNNKDNNSKKRSKSKKRNMAESSVKQEIISNSFPIEKNFENNFFSESNYSKKKGKGNTIRGSVNEFRINNQEKEKQLSNIKESVENEKSSKIEKSEKIEDIKEEKEKNKNAKKDFGVIGNIRDLDNFDDLFK